MITGEGMTTKFHGLDVDPFGVCTETRPLLAVRGTVARSSVSETWEKDASTLLNWTFVVPERFAPWRRTVVPGPPLEGVADSRTGVGSTTNDVVDVALEAALAIAIGPVDAPTGTMAVSVLGDLMTNEALLPLKVTLVTPSSLAPWISTG